MILTQPLIITSRLCAGIKIDNGTGDGKPDAIISVQPTHVDSDGRTKWTYWIDQDGETIGHEESTIGTHVRSDDPSEGASEAIATLLSFLEAAAESYRYTMDGNTSENSDLFPPAVMEWAYMNDSEISYARMELEGETL